MKTRNIKLLVAIGCITASVCLSTTAMAQNRKLKDGTIIYNDGTKRLPNGTIIYNDGRKVKNSDRNIILPDGTVVYPERRQRSVRNNRNGNAQQLPPGQAKKMYGGSAKNYAPGQLKKDKNNNKRNDRSFDKRSDENRKTLKTRKGKKG